MIDHVRREDTLATTGSAKAVATGPHLSTAPVLAVLVCHNGQRWLPGVLDAMRSLTVRPRHVLAVDTGSSDRTPTLLSEAAGDEDGTPGARPALLDGVLRLDASSGFGDAVAEALAEATERWGDPGAWLWLIHDDSAPEPDCLENLLHIADVDAGAAVLGPLGLDWDDPRLVVDGGLSLDASGQPQTGMGPSELDPTLRLPAPGTGEPGVETAGAGQAGPGVSSALQVSEALAVSTACVLVRREVFEHLDGFDAELPVACDDVDFGWRANAADHLVLCVPSARMRHASALSRGSRASGAVPDGWPGTFRAARRAHGVRTFLVNATWWSFALGVPRLAAITLVRALGHATLRRGPEAAAEIAAFWGLLSGGLGLLAGRKARRRITPAPQSVRGLLTSRTTRLRNGMRGFFARLVRDRVHRDVALGRATDATTLGSPDEHAPSAPPEPVVGPAALPSGALAQAGVSRRAAGLRRPSGPVVVPVATPSTGTTAGASGFVTDAAVAGSAGTRAESVAGSGNGTIVKPRPSPVPRETSPPPEQVSPPPEQVSPSPEQASSPDDLLLVPVDRRRVLRELVFTPPVVMAVALIVFALVVNGVLAESPRFGPGLHGGRLLPAADLADTWSRYVAAWHPVHAGTGSPAPAGLLVLAVLGTVLLPVGGPSTVLSVLMLFGVALAGVSAYASTRSIPVSRAWRAVAATAYALVPVATMAAAHGRLGVVVTHILVPPILAGIASVVGLTRLTAVTTRTARTSGHWLATACLTAGGMAVLGAFHPLMHVLLLLVTLLGFVLVPAEARRAPRRLAGLAALVVLPVACLLPWPVALVRNPELLVHGPGARVLEQQAGLSLVALHPGGSPAGWAGAVVVAAAIVALLLGRTRAAMPGVVVAVAGWASAVVVTTVRVDPVWGGPDTVGWTGGPLLLTAAGLLWIVLAAVHGPSRRPFSEALPVRRATAAVLVLGLAALTSAAALAGSSGPLRTRSGIATPAVAADLAEPGYLLAVNSGPQPPRFIGDGLAHFGTDAIVPAPTAPAWLRDVEADLLSGRSERVRGALASAAARGAGLIALPAPAAERVRDLASDLVSANGRLADGRSVLRVLLPSTPVELLGPALAETARRSPSPSPQSRPVEVEATLPNVAVRVSEGGAGRLLVLAAENEAGWQARVNGRPAPLATAWGHQVAVPLPEGRSKVSITFTQVPRTTLLAVQAAAILFTVVGALPTRGRRREDELAR